MASQEEDAVSKLTDSFKVLHEKVAATIVGFAAIGSVIRGLQGTQEGYQLGYSIQHIFFELADALRVPIRLLTTEFEGLANSAHFLNADISKGLRGQQANDQMLAAFQGLLKDRSPAGVQNFIRGATGAAATVSKPTENLKPMLTTSFGDVAGLQAKFQQLSTENPAQQRGLSLVEHVYNVLVKIYNKLPGQDKLTEIPNPAIKNN